MRVYEMKKDYEKVTKGNKGKPHEKIELFMKKHVINNLTLYCKNTAEESNIYAEA